MYITAIPNRGSPPAILLRESYRLHGQVKTRTLANLSKLPPEAIEVLRLSLKGQALVPVERQFQIHGARSHGHIQAVLTAMRRLGLPQLLATRPCRERELILALLAARILRPGSKRTIARWLHTTTLPEMLDLGAFDEDDLCAAMDWLLKAQPRIERKLAARHLCADGVVMLDLSSVYVEDVHSSPEAFGDSRDGKKERKRINFGLLADADGTPVAVSVFGDEVRGLDTLMPQVTILRRRFGLKRFVLVGDRGMPTQAHVAALHASAGVDWITELRLPAIRRLVEERAIQMDLFDERGLFELTHPDYPGERLVACRNPQRAERRKAKREASLAATAKRLEAVRARVAAGQLKAPDGIGVAVGMVIDKDKVGKHFLLDIAEGRFAFSLDEAKVTHEEVLDGICVIRASAGAARLSAPEVVRQYERLCQVERASRSMRTGSLKVQPAHHRPEDQVRAHLFLCMLAYYVQRNMLEAWRPLLLAGEDPEAKPTRPLMAAACRPESARRKAQTRHLGDGRNGRSFQALLEELAQITRNTCGVPGDQTARGEARTFGLETRANPTQKQALELLETIRAHSPAPVQAEARHLGPQACLDP